MSNRNPNRPEYFSAAGYVLHLLAETGNQFTDFQPYVAAINDRGFVAFQAVLHDGASGAYVTDGASITCAIAAGIGPLASICSHPDIDLDVGMACYATDRSGARIVIEARSGALRTIARDAGPLGPTINARGRVAFRIDRHREGAAILVGDGQSISEVAARNERFMDFQGLPVINDRGAVAFRADLVGGGQGIYCAHEGRVATIAEAGPVFAELGTFPVLDSAGAVAFVASLTDERSGIFVADHGRVDTALDTTGAFESFRGVLFAAAGALVFYGTPRGGELGIFSGPDPVRDRILGVGMPFLGSTVAEFALNPVSINLSGQLAIRVALADGRQVIVRA
ncbi:MAG: choice-of-anchor tandem repeat NxxGxxAF-containing protein, partial [Chloroflexota bacterium]